MPLHQFVICHRSFVMRFALAIGYRLLVMREALDDLCLFSQFGDEFFYAVYPNTSFSRLWGVDFLNF